MQTTFGPNVLPGAVVKAVKEIAETAKKAVETVPIVNQEEPVQKLMTPEPELIKNTDWKEIFNAVRDKINGYCTELCGKFTIFGEKLEKVFNNITTPKAEE